MVFVNWDDFESVRMERISMVAKVDISEMEKKYLRG